MMCETRWTAGPWSCDLPENGYIAIECMGNRIARVDVEADDPKVVESLIANANLIAAVTELYSVVDRFVEICDNAPPVEILKLIGDLVEPARAALAKARGEEQT